MICGSFEFPERIPGDRREVEGKQEEQAEL